MKGTPKPIRIVKSQLFIDINDTYFSSSTSTIYIQTTGPNERENPNKCKQIANTLSNPIL